MRSPFPGMDPYLERHWRDVHATAIVYARRTLQRQLGGSLKARINERQIREPPAGAGGGLYVFHQGTRAAAAAGGVDQATPATVDVAIAEPLVIRRFSDTTRQPFIEIIDVGHAGRLVTSIELLSPSNKLPGDGRNQYRQKRSESIDAGANFVEIDLTRTGRRELALREAVLPASYRTPYLACVYRAAPADRFEVYRIPLRERLPAIRIPLRPGDRDVALDLQACLDLAYEDGAYDDIDYAEPPEPLLDPEDDAWADALLRAAGKR